MAKDSLVDATRLLLQTSAKVYYNGLSDCAKASLRANFFAADKHGRRRIPIQDLLNSAPATAHDPARSSLLRFLDADNSGYLELDEFITLHFIDELSCFHCSCCGLPILVGGYSCSQCPPPGPHSFDICLSCYASSAPPAALRHHHPRTSFVNLVANFQQRGASLTAWKNTMPSTNVTSEIADVNGLGVADFFCDGCGAGIVTDRYTCTVCVNSFDLCLSCYSSPPQYFRHIHPFSSFTRRARSQQAMAMAAPMNTMDMSSMTAAMMGAQNANMAAAMAQQHLYAYPSYAAPAQTSSKIGVGIELLSKFADVLLN